MPEVTYRNIVNVETAERFWSSLWANYVRNKGTTSLVYWMEQFKDAVEFNVLLMTLGDLIQCDTIPERNWSQCSLNEDKLLSIFDTDTLEEYRRENKLKQYLPRREVSSCSNQVRVKGEVKTTGLDRVGFAKAANSEYRYDTVALDKYKQEVINEVNKGMAKVRQLYPELSNDTASYDAIAVQVVDHIIVNKKSKYTQGESYIDSRGRAIKGNLSKLCNPIGNKVFRSLIVI